MGTATFVVKPARLESRWAQWHQRELDWWDDSGRDTVSDLELLPAAKLLEALNELTQHSLFRDEIGDKVQRQLDRPEEVIVLIALSVLESIRATDQAARVRSFAGDSRANVRARARGVYKSLTSG